MPGYQHYALAGWHTNARVDTNTSREKVEHYLPYRCAEIIDELSSDLFVVASQDTIEISDLLAQAAGVSNYHGIALIKMFNLPDHPATLLGTEMTRLIANYYPEDFRS